MEKIKVKTNEFDLIPMGIVQSEKRRSYTILSDLPFTDIDNAFSDVSVISYVLESGDEIVYKDGILVTAITDHKDGTYTIEISIDATKAELAATKSELETAKEQIITANLMINALSDTIVLISVPSI